MRTIVALGLLTQPRKESLAKRDLVQAPLLSARDWMCTSHAVKRIVGLAVVKDGACGGEALVRSVKGGLD